MKIKTKQQELFACWDHGYKKLVASIKPDLFLKFQWNITEKIQKIERFYFLIKII